MHKQNKRASENECACSNTFKRDRKSLGSIKMSSIYTRFIKNYVVEIAIGTGALVLISFYSMKHFTKSKKITRIIDTMEVFKKKTVLMKNSDLVEEMVSILIKGGAAKLQVISDFDHTITRVHLNGTVCTSTYGVLESGPDVNEDYKNQCSRLVDYYHPIEIDPNLSVEEKVPYMREWYSKSRDLMITFGLKEENIKDKVRKYSPILRDGCDTVFRMLHSHDVPLLIFSAGIGDVLKEVLKQKGQLYPNMKIIANFMEFNKEGNVLGYKNDMIHTFNKNQSSIENSDYFNHLKSRSNIILLGDSLGDINMADGVKDANCILKIGFLNHKVEENLPKFMKAYDIVLTDDQTMDLVNGLLQSIL